MDDKPLADQVYDLLHSKKPELAETFRRQFTCGSNSDTAQIKALNDFFRIELSKLSMNTREERSVLRDDLTTSIWIKYFEKFVLPVMFRFDVPKG